MYGLMGITSDAALICAGAIGLAVSIVHGVLMHRLMVIPLLASGDNSGLSGPGRRLLAPLLHLSTVTWFASGLCLIIAPYHFDPILRATTCAIAAALYTYGAVFNFWGTRGKHPGWVLLAIAVILIAVGS